MRRLEAICQGQFIKKKTLHVRRWQWKHPNDWPRIYIHTHTLNKIATFFILILFFFFRVHIVDISSIDEQHITQKKKMMKRKMVRLYTSLHYVIDVCHIHYSSFISPFIITTRKKRAHFVHKGKGFRYNIIDAYLSIFKALSFTYPLICTIVVMSVSLLLVFYV
jgi:hypothetical protein